MSSTEKVGEVLALSVSELSGALSPWVGNQLSSMGDQIGALVLSAVSGGVISWAITRWFDWKARQKQVERDETIRREQGDRDKRRNLFEYRHWRMSQSFARQKQWEVNIDTSPWYRYNWVLSATPNFHERIKSVRFTIESMLPERDSVELTKEFSSRSEKTPSIGASWGIDRHGRGYWELDGSEECRITFDKKKIINDADEVVIFYETEGGESFYERHLISPFDSMKDYRPWEIIDFGECD